MFQGKLLSLNRLKFSTVLIVVSSAIFLGWGLASAASKTWTYGDYTRDCQFASMGVDGLYYDFEGAVITPGDGWTITPFTDENGTTYTICGPEYYITSATFNASTDKDTYAPGETVLVSVSADNGWYGSGGTGIGVAAAFGGTQVAQCSLTNVCSASGSFTAPAAPAYGVHTIQLSGCTVSAEYCAPSSMNITVEEPPPAMACGQDFTSSGSVTIPAGVTGLVKAKIVGGGGGGGGSDGSGDNHAGGGGGSGGYRYETIAATVGQVVNVTVGQGGLPASWVFNGNYICGPGGTSNTKNGTNGQSSSVSGNFGTLTATGGQGAGGSTSDNGDGFSGAGGSPNGVAGGVIDNNRNQYNATFGGSNGSGYGSGGSSNGASVTAEICPVGGQNGFVRVEWACPTATPTTPTVNLFFSISP